MGFFFDGLADGFRIGFSSPLSTLRPSRRNLPSALEHPKVVDKYLQKEITENRVAGPFLPEACVSHISRFGVIPKSHQYNKWRLIFDLSSPRGQCERRSPKGALLNVLCLCQRRSAQDTGQWPKLHVDKIDIKSAFRLIPVHPADRHLLAMSWRGALYIDTCLPFGLRSAPRLFNIAADLLEWILKDRGVTFVMHYLLNVGPPKSAECQKNLGIIKEVCHTLGIPLALEKVEGPSTALEFWGISLDTCLMEARLPDEKLERTKRTVREWLHKKSATKREILSLVGLLQHATKVVRPGRSFLSRMYGTAVRVPELHYFTRLNKEFRSDLTRWHLFLEGWNGTRFLQVAGFPQASSLSIQTDASGNWGCGGYLGGSWFKWQWPPEWLPVAIMAKELVPIVLSCAVWGRRMVRRVVLFQCDNTSVGSAIKKGSSKDPLVMRLLRCLWFFCGIF